MEYYELVHDENVIEPVTLDEAKSFLRVDSTGEDTYITALIQSAREWAEKFTNRDWVEKEYILNISNFKQTVKLRRYPLKSVDSVTLHLSDGTEKTLVLDVDYRVFKQNHDFAIILILENYELEDRSDAMIIKFTTDVDEEKDILEKAILMRVGSLFEIRIDTVKEKETASENMLYPYRLSSIIW